MSWSDIFIPSTSQTADEQAENYARQQEEYQRRLKARQLEGSPIMPLEDQNAAAWTGFGEGAKEGWNNVLDAPGKAVNAVGDATSRSLWGIVKGVPWWVWVALLVAGFLYVGGTEIVRAWVRSYAKRA